MRVSRDAAGLFAAVGVALVVVALGMLGWTRGTGGQVTGYAAAAVTAVVGLSCLTIAFGMAAGWWR